MGQIPVSSDYAKQVNQTAKEYAPDWLADMFVPADIEPSDFASPIGMPVKGGSKLIQALLKRLGGTSPSKKKVNFDPKMDRRQFFRTLTGGPARDADEMRQILQDRTYTDDPDNWVQRPLADGENRVWDKLTERYGDAGTPPDVFAMDRAYNKTGDFEAEPDLVDKVKGWSDHLSENLLNEYRKALKGESLQEFEKGLREAGSGSAKLVDAVMRRMGLRK